MGNRSMHVTAMFLSKVLKDGQDERTEVQLAQFKKALSEINTPYGHCVSLPVFVIGHSQPKSM